jgi:hypothetical protein
MAISRIPQSIKRMSVARVWFPATEKPFLRHRVETDSESYKHRILGLRHVQLFTTHRGPQFKYPLEHDLPRHSTIVFIGLKYKYVAAVMWIFSQVSSRLSYSRRFCPLPPKKHICSVPNKKSFVFKSRIQVSASAMPYSKMNRSFLSGYMGFSHICMILSSYSVTSHEPMASFPP